MAYNSMICIGYHKEGVEDETPDVLMRISRSDLYDIERIVKFACSESDNFGFIQNCVYLVDRIRWVLDDHWEQIDDEED